VLPGSTRLKRSATSERGLFRLPKTDLGLATKARNHEKRIIFPPVRTVAASLFRVLRVFVAPFRFLGVSCPRSSGEPPAGLPGGQPAEQPGE